ncbi:MAG: glycosyl hydrolase family 28-related protein [Microcoleaceae cyanobacterium]
MKKFLILFFGTIALLGIITAGYALMQLFQPDISVANNPSNPISLSSGVSLSQNTGGNCGSPSGGENDNIIADFHGKEAYPWTNKIRWNCVYNINDFKGSSLVNQFNNARDAAANNGGGVVYFPAGTYQFNENIQLKDGVVLRGETPNIKTAKSSDYLPTSKLVFPKYEPKLSGNGTPNETAFKKITTTNPDKDSNIGLINLDINRAAIAFVGKMETHQNQNIIVFGVRSNNVAKPDPKVPDTSFQNPWQRHSDRFATNIKIAAFQNVLVANNRINDQITDNFEQPGYKLKTSDKKSVITYRDGKKAVFNYSNHYGISVNRSGKEGGFTLAATPQTEPGLFRKGIVIRDNWVYHTMRVAIHASGEGLIIQNNQVRDQPNKQWWLHPTGLREATGAVTLENRAIDWSGYNVLVEGNDYQVYRHKIAETKYLSVDGEGILIQECCGGTKVNGVVIQNNQGNGYIGLYKVQDIKNARIENNQLTTNNADIFIVADTNNQPYRMENVKVLNNTVGGNIIMKASLGGSGNIVQGNVSKGSGEIEYSCSVEVKNNSGFSDAPCLQ